MVLSRVRKGVCVGEGRATTELCPFGQYRFKRWGYNANNNNNYITFSAAAEALKLALPSFSVCALRDAEMKTHKHKCCGNHGAKPS